MALGAMKLVQLTRSGAVHLPRIRDLSQHAINLINASVPGLQRHRGDPETSAGPGQTRQAAILPDKLLKPIIKT